MKATNTALASSKVNNRPIHKQRAIPNKLLTSETVP